MTFSIYRRARSCRLTVTTPEGQSFVVENMTGDSGFSIEFECVRTMDDKLGEGRVVAYNLPPESISVMESAQVRRTDDPDSLLVDEILRTSGVASDAADALAAGFLVCEVEAGYDGVVSRIFSCVGAKSSSGYDDAGEQGRDSAGRFARERGGLTYRTKIEAVDALDGVLLGLSTATFPAGTTMFELVDYLRRQAGLGPGNLTYQALSGIIGESRLDSPYHVGGGQALAHLRNVLGYLPLRWFVDDREIWICGRDGVPNQGAVPAYVPGEILEPDLLTTRPRRDDGGYVVCECLLSPGLAPGRLVRLSEAGLSFALEGLSPQDQDIAFAQVPPGLYRLDEVRHVGSTSDMNRWTSALRLRPGVAALA